MKVNNVDELRQRIQTVWDNLTSVLLTRQSSSGALAFVLASRPKVDTLNTNFNILLREIVSINV